MVAILETCLWKGGNPKTSPCVKQNSPQGQPRAPPYPGALQADMRAERCEHLQVNLVPVQVQDWESKWDFGNTPSPSEHDLCAR